MSKRWIGHLETSNAQGYQTTAQQERKVIWSDEKKMILGKVSSTKRIALKITRRTNIVATNFDWEELKRRPNICGWTSWKIRKSNSRNRVHKLLNGCALFDFGAYAQLDDLLSTRINQACIYDVGSAKVQLINKKKGSWEQAAMA